MIKLENTEVLGWEHAIRGMRNPMNSWEKSDSLPCDILNELTEKNYKSRCAGCKNEFVGRPNCHIIGENDHDLMMRLAKGGPVHAKYRRMIVVYVDITAPLYWWKEFDTYKVGTVANSCSTMHKIHAKEFTLEDFSHEHLITPETARDDCEWNGEYYDVPIVCLNYTIDMLNIYRKKYNDASNKLKRTDLTNAERKHVKAQQKLFWWQMIQLLPSSYNQKRTIMLNYEVLAGIYPSRKDHKLDEWHTFCDWIESLPYSEIITGKSAAEESYERGQALMEGMKKVIDPVERASEASRAMSDIMGSLKDLKKEFGVVSPSKVSDKSDDGILVGALDIYTIGLNDEDLKKISAGEEIELNMDVEGEAKILRSISICIKKEPVKEV